MRIIDLDKKHEDSYLVCMEEWSEGMVRAKPIKEKWCRTMIGRGLRVKLALTDGNNVGGMIEYMPIEESFADGKDLYFINCIWVHGHPEKGVGNVQGWGMGKALLKAAEGDVKSLSAKGLVAWGVAMDFWMTASWYEKHGYKRVDQDGMMALVWKQFAPDAVPPKWHKGKFVQELVEGKVKMTAFFHGQCPSQNSVYLKAKQVAEEFVGKIVFEEMNMNIAENRHKYGMNTGLYVDGKNISQGPPVGYDEIKAKVEERVKSLG